MVFYRIIMKNVQIEGFLVPVYNLKPFIFSNLSWNLAKYAHFGLWTPGLEAHYLLPDIKKRMIKRIWAQKNF